MEFLKHHPVLKVISRIILLIFLSLLAMLASAGASETKSFSFSYQGYPIQMELAMNANLAKTYIANRPAKTANLGSYYQAFLKELPGDNVIDQIIDCLNQFVVAYKLPESSKPEIVARFIQCIPYNYEECGPGKTAHCDYPYTTLFRKSGTCLDKAILGVAILKKLGYGTMLLYFNDIKIPDGGTDEHAAFAVKSEGPRAYYNGYAYIEVAHVCQFDANETGHIGFMPRVDPNGYLTDDPDNLNDADNYNNAVKLGQVLTYLQSDGETY